MAYTLDIVTNPPLPLPAQGQPLVPLYRRSFSTSKYASMKDLADDLGVSKILHRALKQPVALTVGLQLTILPDKDIQDALIAAGEQALPTPDQNSITIYWAPTAPDGHFAPQFLLIDCTEPLWRWRSETTFNQPDPKDPSFKVVTKEQKPSLEIREQNEANITGFITSPAGTRSLVFLKPGFNLTPPGGAVRLALHRPASVAYPQIIEETDPIVSIPFDAVAPWEADNV